MSISVTKTYLPHLDEYIQYLKRIWSSGWVTNNGELVQELEERLAKYLGVPYLQFVSNGTIAIQLALKALEVDGDVITTPFSYVASVNSILWENCTPVFVDIEEQTFGLDATKIAAAITERTSAILAVHVYGYPCDVKAIQDIANKNNLKVIYDGAHAFGCNFNGTSLLNFGDLSTMSFHATKLFHTIEGGAVIAHTAEMSKKISLLKSFGHYYDDYLLVGINGKNSEFHAAMGLCMLPKIKELIEQRKKIFDWYDKGLSGLGLLRPMTRHEFEYNYSYYPVLFDSEETLLHAVVQLNRNDIFPRRYFFPALSTLPFLRSRSCPIAEDISRRVICLPIYNGLKEDQVQMICDVLGGLC